MRDSRHTSPTRARRASESDRGRALHRTCTSVQRGWSKSARNAASVRTHGSPITTTTLPIRGTRSSRTSAFASVRPSSRMACTSVS
ncbi:MAG: hypothetical protein ACK56F_15195, partial [bacterium]